MSTCTSKTNVVRLIHEERRLAVVEISSVCMRLGLMLLGFRYLVFTGYMGLSIIWLFTRFPERALISRKGFTLCYWLRSWLCFWLCFCSRLYSSCYWFLETTNSLSYKNYNVFNATSVQDQFWNDYFLHSLTQASWFSPKLLLFVYR